MYSFVFISIHALVSCRVHGNADQIVPKIAR
jgi:hypothetical protein